MLAACLKPILPCPRSFALRMRPVARDLGWLGIVQTRHDQPEPLTALEQAQRQQFFRKGLPAVALPVTEVRQSLFDARRAQVTRAAFVYRVIRIIGVERKQDGLPPAACLANACPGYRIASRTIACAAARIAASLYSLLQRLTGRRSNTRARTC